MVIGSRKRCENVTAIPSKIVFAALDTLAMYSAKFIRKCSSTGLPPLARKRSRNRGLSSTVGLASGQGKHAPAKRVGSCTLSSVRSGGVTRPACVMARAGFFAWALVSLARSAGARQRPRFEPTDLEMEKTGLVELDTQVGFVHGDLPWRLVVPDVEIDVGLTPEVELDVDATYAVEGPDDGRFTFDHSAPENIWLSVKLGLLDTREGKG